MVRNNFSAKVKQKVKIHTGKCLLCKWKRHTGSLPVPIQISCSYKQQLSSKRLAQALVSFLLDLCQGLHCSLTVVILTMEVKAAVFTTGSTKMSGSGST